MSELITRSITGVVLVAVVVFATSYSFETSVFFWTLVTVLGVRELLQNLMGTFLCSVLLAITAASVVGLGFFSFSDQVFQFDLGSYNGLNSVAFLSVIWANDSFAYLGGMTLGRKFISKGLSPIISPKKSWEGALIGSLFSALVAYLFIGTLGIFLGLFIGILATLSDLVESKAKRKAGIKDSGTLLPGHGGILDRFDALLLSAPFTFIVIYIISQ